MLLESLIFFSPPGTNPCSFSFHNVDSRVDNRFGLVTRHSNAHSWLNYIYSTQIKTSHQNIFKSFLLMLPSFSSNCIEICSTIFLSDNRNAIIFRVCGPRVALTTLSFYLKISHTHTQTHTIWHGATGKKRVCIE